MNYYTTTLSSINFSHSTHTTAFLSLENIQNVTQYAINVTTTHSTFDDKPSSPYNLTQKIIIAIVFIILSLLTVIGNLMVMISFKIDKQLQTISNYFLFSLAIADLAIGLVSMPLFTVQTIAGYWPFGSFVCDTWLSLDYLASNASVLNLLIISFDRYFSVTRPLTYRAKRTNRKAAIMISFAWLISLILWPPWIYSWPYIEGKRTVPDYECYIQFIETNQLITFITAIAAFYVPVTVMCFLYFRIWLETKKRQKDLPNLQAGGGGGAFSHQSIKKDASKRSNSSDETSTINHQIGEYIDPNFWHPPHLAGDNESNSYYSGAHPHSTHDLSRRTSTRNCKSDSVLESIKNWCVAWWHSGQEEDSFEDFGDWCDYEGEQSYGEYGTPCTSETPVQSSVSRCTSLNIIRDPYARGSYCQSMVNDSPSTFVKNRQQQTLVATQSSNVGMKPNNADKAQSSNLKRSLSQDSVYTILIRLPIEGNSGGGGGAGSSSAGNSGGNDARSSGPSAPGGIDNAERDLKLPSIKMYPEDANLSKIIMSKGAGGSSSVDEFGTLKKGEKDPFALNTPHPSYEFNNRLPLNAKIIPRKTVMTAREKQQQKAALNKKKKSQEKRQESKAAKTLSAILLSFIITWLPYNILVLLKPLTTCTKCIPQELWDFFYALCYINSTINPILYALCNASFRRTYVRILTCKWQSRNREGISRGVYN